MAKRIEWTATAQSQYKEVVSYLINEWSIAVAENFIDTLDKKLNLLAEFPYLGAKSTRHPRIRQLVINKFNTLYYEVQIDKILVLGLEDNRQEM